MSSHVHCQNCGTHFLKQAELDRHTRKEHANLTKGGQRGELPQDANASIQEQPASMRKGLKFERSHKE